MYAVFRENTYPPDLDLTEDANFHEFQKAHADRPTRARLSQRSAKGDI